MFPHGNTYLQLLPSQAELSRQAERRFALTDAAREARRRTSRPAGMQRPAGPVRRLRHAVAGRLVAAARLIDAT